jgi:hypothetical protein
MIDRNEIARIASLAGLQLDAREADPEALRARMLEALRS